MSLINCPECQKNISDQAITCVYCGFVLKSSIKCPECSALNKEDSQFCQNCGYPFRDENNFINPDGLIEVKCRHCNKIFDFKKENYLADTHYQCPNCSESDYCSFLKTCPKCKKETLFHLGNFSDT